MPTKRKTSKARPRRRNAKNARGSAKLAISTALLLILSAFLAGVVLVVAFKKETQEAKSVATRPAADVEAGGALSQRAIPEEVPPETPVTTEDIPEEAPPKVPAEGLPRSGGGQAALRVPASVPERPVEDKGSLVIIIDDVGMNLGQLEPFLKFPGPITFAILPSLPYTEAAARKIREAGKEYILHQPMEAEGGNKTGPGAILRSMDQLEVLAALSANLAELPGARGINNHMGSAGTADVELMRTILGLARERGLYFVDSRTTARTSGPEAAAAENTRIWERDVFLDNKSDRESMETMVREGMGLARKNGRAVMIGHVWSAELAKLLMDLYPELVEEGYSLSTISRLVTGGGDAGPGD